MDKCVDCKYAVRREYPVTKWDYSNMYVCRICKNRKAKSYGCTVWRGFRWDDDACALFEPRKEGEEWED